MGKTGHSESEVLPSSHDVLAMVYDYITITTNNTEHCICILSYSFRSCLTVAAEILQPFPSVFFPRQLIDAARSLNIWCPGNGK